MKRSPELTPLSHDHHQALFAAQRLKRAEAGSDARRTFLEFWESHGRAHFVIEEEILLPAWIAGDPQADRALAARVAAEHLEIRSAARELDDEELPPDRLHEVGALLERHVRFEERELFSMIEAALADDALAALGAEIEAAERAAKA